VNTEVTVALARPEHCAAIAELLDELDSFYGATDVEPAGQRRDHIREGLFASPPAAYALLAWVSDRGERLAGFASYSFLWPAAGRTRSLYLKELYVAETCRGKGVGALLMEALRLTATQHGCSRVEWTTDDDNPGAMRFYEALGYSPKPSKIFYRLEGDRLRRAARVISPGDLGEPQQTFHDDSGQKQAFGIGH
jgi:GNAT superfamily N-acetyltransferase